MKTRYFKCTWAAVTILTVLAGGALADWDVEQPSKYVQMPDLRPDLGIDVRATHPSVVADDFPCREPGFVTNIHIWASWLHDQVPGVPTNVVFTLSIHDDIPAQQSGTEYSMPGSLRWHQRFEPGSYTARIYNEGIPEGWYDPSAPQGGYYEPRADTNCWQYNFSINPADAFFQEGTPESNVVYWLDVQALPLDDLTQFGWKTSEMHWNDDAVWGEGEEPFQGPWNELRYPPGHEFEGMSIDLAFVIVSGIPEAEDLDFGDAPDQPYPTLLASDGARHVITGPPWLGDLQDGPDPESDGQQDPSALGDDNGGGDDEDGVWFPGTPGRLLRGVSNFVTVVVGDPAGGGGTVQLWVDFDQSGSWQHPQEQAYSAYLAAGTNYIPIAAPTGSVLGQTFCRARISTQGGLTPTGLATGGEVEDHPVTIQDPFPADWCNLQWPPATTTTVGMATESIYGQIWVPGVTDQPGPGPSVAAQLGYGPDGSLPAGNASWIWGTSPYNAAFAGDPPNDEHATTLTVPTPGTYDYCYRYTLDGANWTYGDLNGSGDGYAASNAGHLVVQALPEDECPKWIQEPDCDYGIDIQSWHYGETGQMRTTADDWLCDGRPITAIRWWGSYIGWPEEVPPADPQAGRPTAFELTWYTDIPSGELTEWSQPGGVITSIVVQLLPYGAQAGRPGFVTENYYCLSDLRELVPPPEPPFEHEYEYYVELEEPWNEKDGRVYWLSVRAFYPTEASSPYPWGWKTTSWRYNWNDDAVHMIEQRDWAEMIYPPQVPPWAGIENHPYMGKSVNMAFHLYTDICPRRAKKWEQPPDMITGTNMPSWMIEGMAQPGVTVLRADDFISDGRRITDIHWWGSYINWMMETHGAETNPVAPPSGLMSPIGFRLSWHEHDDASELPGALLRNDFVPIQYCHEMYYGTVTQTWARDTLEHEYQYYVDLLDEEAVPEGPWYEERGTHYWLNVQAVFPQGFEPSEQSHMGWGWKTTLMIDLLPSVESYDDGLSWRMAIRPPPPLEGPFDLSFELTTDEVAPGPGGPIVITNISFAVTNQYDVWSVGDVGVGKQYLQFSPSIVVTTWTDVATNPAPFPAPATNFWFRVSGASNEYYRVIQR